MIDVKKIRQRKRIEKRAIHKIVENPKKHIKMMSKSLTNKKKTYQSYQNLIKTRERESLMKTTLRKFEQIQHFISWAI